VLRNVVSERIIRVRRREERLDGEQDGPDLERRGPLVLENIKADSTELKHTHDEKGGGGNVPCRCLDGRSLSRI
jgi:hypothetical protein